ncbi:MAG: hypothetical protein C5B52_16170 [Bacteroidetes bacterium]|nr:MAG: hypothetical protein C5B52_16170 [Bacteroidota bacterium]
MKKSLIVSTLAMCFGGLTHLMAQDNVNRTSPCDNKIIQKEADSLKRVLANGGFVVLREASIIMESENELPIIVPLNEATLYQVVFIGDVNSNAYEVKMYDYSERQVVYQRKSVSDADANVISYSYTPKTTEYHMIKPLQINFKQKKNLCGYVILFKKTTDSQASAK